MCAKIKNLKKSKEHFSAATVKPDDRFTGRKLVVLSDTVSGGNVERSARNMSLRMANIRDFSSSRTDAGTVRRALEQADGLVFDKLKIAVVNETHDEQVRMLTTASRSNKIFLKSEPERYVYALASKSRKKIRATDFSDSDTSSWGIQATNILTSRYSGKNIRIAILDTGFSLKHGDFKKRKITHKSARV
jgi:subtilisin